MDDVDEGGGGVAPGTGGRWSGPIGRLRLVGRVEGATLVALLFLAVPLERAAGWPALASVLGPIHGLAFAVYLVCAFELVGTGELVGAAAWRAVFASVVPFGPFVNDRFLVRLETRPDAKRSARRRVPQSSIS